MARCTHVKAARRRYPQSECGIPGGIKQGQSYYWWKFKRGSKHFSLTPPKRSQLTQSAFYSQLYEIEDRIADLTASSDLPSEVEGIAEELRSLAEECQGSLENMPESLQQGPTGEMLQERIDACEGAADELEGIEMDDFEDEDFEPDEQDEGELDDEYEARIESDRDDYTNGRDGREIEHWQEKLDEVQAVSIDAP
jgi:hypothetical protein